MVFLPRLVVLLRRFAAGNPIELGRHDEIVLVQPFDLLRSQRDCRVPPAKGDVGMVPLGLGEFGRAVDKPERFAEVLEAIGPLDARRLIEQFPLRCLRVISGSFGSGKRRDASTARRPTLLGECYWHGVNSSTRAG